MVFQYNTSMTKLLRGDPTSAFDAMSDSEYIDFLNSVSGEKCHPSEQSVDTLTKSDLILMAGQFVGAGKSTLINALRQNGVINVPSWTNRDLRPGEVEGVDKFHRSLGEFAVAAQAGTFLEIEQVRPGVFYATPADLSAGERYVKDLEIKGAMRLREFAPELPIIIPLPSLEYDSGRRVTEWERRVIEREALNRSVTERGIIDLANRLDGAAEEAERILELDLLNDPNTLVIVTTNDPNTALNGIRKFLDTGERSETRQIEVHLSALSELAQTV